jgi:hypothetical protein
LLHYTSTFPYKNTIAFPEIKRAMGSMPNLPAFNHINDIIVMTPGILVLIFKGAVENADKGFTAFQLAIILWIT